MSDYRNMVGEGELFGRISGGFRKVMESVGRGRYGWDENGVVVCECDGSGVAPVEEASKKVGISVIEVRFVEDGRGDRDLDEEHVEEREFDDAQEALEYAVEKYGVRKFDRNRGTAKSAIDYLERSQFEVVPHGFEFAEDEGGTVCVKVDEGVVGAGVGAGIGACVGGPVGAVAGGALGQALTGEAEEGDAGGQAGGSSGDRGQVQGAEGSVADDDAVASEVPQQVNGSVNECGGRQRTGTYRRVSEGDENMQSFLDGLQSVVDEMEPEVKANLPLDTDLATVMRDFRDVDWLSEVGRQLRDADGSDVKRTVGYALAYLYEILRANYDYPEIWDILDCFEHIAHFANELSRDDNAREIAKMSDGERSRAANAALTWCRTHAGPAVLRLMSYVNDNPGYRNRFRRDR